MSDVFRLYTDRFEGFDAIFPPGAFQEPVEDIRHARPWRISRGPEFFFFDWFLPPPRFQEPIEDIRRGRPTRITRGPELFESFVAIFPPGVFQEFLDDIRPGRPRRISVAPDLFDSLRAIVPPGRFQEPIEDIRRGRPTRRARANADLFESFLELAIPFEPWLYYLLEDLREARPNRIARAGYLFDPILLPQVPPGAFQEPIEDIRKAKPSRIERRSPDLFEPLEQPPVPPWLYYQLEDINRTRLPRHSRGPIVFEPLLQHPRFPIFVEGIEDIRSRPTNKAKADSFFDVIPTFSDSLDDRWRIFQAERPEWPRKARAPDSFDPILEQVPPSLFEKWLFYLPEPRKQTGWRNRLNKAEDVFNYEPNLVFATDLLKIKAMFILTLEKTVLEHDKIAIDVEVI